MLCATRRNRTVVDSQDGSLSSPLTVLIFNLINLDVVSFRDNRRWSDAAWTTRDADLA
jgi:hypothetical protein